MLRELLAPHTPYEMTYSPADTNEPDSTPDPRPHDHSALPPGARLNEMEILRVLAVGGFGIVYLARDHSLDRDVAVKEFMPAQLAGRSEGQRVTVRSKADFETFRLGLQSFVNEAKLLAQFTHPSMVKVYRFWEANGTGYMVMPYLRGPTLREVRQSMSQPPTEAWLRSVIDPLLDALGMLHAEGVYHRDIAPDNVLVSGNGVPVLLDFGAARRLIGDRTQSLTAILKPSYAPIEQYAEAQQLRQGPWTDLYALAALVTYLLDGLPPPASTARAIHDDMELLAQRRIPGVSRTFLAVIDWALAVRPQDRPQNVAEMRDALNGRRVPPTLRRPRPALPQGEASEPPSPAGVEAFPATQPQHRRSGLPALGIAMPGPRPRAPWTWLAAAASVLVLGALALPLSWQPPSAATPAMAPLTPSHAPPARHVEAPLATPLSTAVENVPTLRVAAASTNTEPPPPIPAPTTQLTPPQRPSSTLSSSTVTTPKAAKRSARKTAGSGERKPSTVAHANTPGPREVCASRSIFTRSHCVQRRCEEPRYKAHPQCVRLRQDMPERYRRND